MKLNVRERIKTLEVLSLYKEGNYVMLKTIDGLKNKLYFSEEEVEKFKISFETNMYRWGVPENETEVVFDFTPGELKLIRDKLTALDKAEKLTADLFPLYEMFIEV